MKLQAANPRGHARFGLQLEMRTAKKDHGAKAATPFTRLPDKYPPPSPFLAEGPLNR